MKNKIFDITLLFAIGFLIGNLYTQFKTNNSISLGNNEVVVQKKQTLQKDNLPLENGGTIYVENIDNQKMVYLSYEDFEYISKRRRYKKIVEKLNALFERMK